MLEPPFFIDFFKTNFEKANLNNANLENCNLLGANLFKTNLEGANLKAANLKNCNMLGADFTNSKLNNVDLVGVFDTDLQISKSIAKKYKIRNFKNYNELIEHVDAVSIVTPTKTHYEVSKFFLIKRLNFEVVFLPDFTNFIFISKFNF